MASATLEEKINKIRQKNEEIRRRHEEVEADKQNAAKLNALVKMVPPTDWPERKEPPEFSDPLPQRSNGINSKSKVTEREYRGGQRQRYHPGGGDGKKTHVFAEGDGPPPDPTYNFLADSEREERSREDSRDNERFRGRGGHPRGSFRKRGGGRDGYSKEYRGSPGQKDSSKPEYEAWRAERNRIDEARISRQRTAEGSWRREWDNNKMNVEEDETGATKSPRLEVSDVVKRDQKEFEKWQTDANDQDSPRGRGGKPYVSRGGSRGSHNNRIYQHSNSFDQFHGPVSPSPIKAPTSPNGIDDRMVVATDKSIKVIVNHGNTTVPKGPVMSVKVTSSSIAGTGRVGPRQKPRVLYSSQSESEIPGNKSPEDKANRVSFNRDMEEQRGYVPKSPHVQRKSDGTSKSPYLTRKEFKYDSQQQKHPEIESKSKSPYLQRKEIKDCTKSDNFLQRKSDFNNRESLSHVKQKNNNSVNDSFKANNNHSQRRNNTTSEKTKYDSQKFMGQKRSDDGTNPKPQRINKQRSKDFKNSNSKEFKGSNSEESSSQSKNLAAEAVEQSTKTLANGSEENRDKGENTENNCQKDFSEESKGVEIVREIQNEENDVSELNIGTKTLGASNELDKVYHNVIDDKKLIVESQSMILSHESPAEASEGDNSSSENTKLINNSEPAILKASEASESISDDTKVIDNLDQTILSEKNAGDSSELMNLSNETTEEEIIAENVERNTETESAAEFSNESKTDKECNEKDEGSVEENVGIEMIVGNETKADKNEVEKAGNVSEEDLKNEENFITKEDSEDLKKFEEEIILTGKSELPNEISDLHERGEGINEIEEDHDITEVESVVGKVDSSTEIEPRQTRTGEKEQQVSNIIVDEQIVVKDSGDKENLIN